MVHSRISKINVGAALITIRADRTILCPIKAKSRENWLISCEVIKNISIDEIKQILKCVDNIPFGRYIGG